MPGEAQPSWCNPFSLLGQAHSSPKEASDHFGSRDLAFPKHLCVHSAPHHLALISSIIVLAMVSGSGPGLEAPRK